MQALEQAKAAAEQRHSEVTAGLAALAGDGGGIMLSQEVGGVMDDDSPSDSESDGGSGALVPALSGAHGGNGAAASAYEDFASSVSPPRAAHEFITSLHLPFMMKTRLRCWRGEARVQDMIL
uniref:Uncharacterized protein n=1 Tax=Calcidiscus leptoporus TaxID=127549 RepID=A0A7S0NXF8_9EUKA|mmetsp:Transcript_36494/g.85259  ORF Transcript_36494/g.85259 Transcript_36494/m.85259 type:complete len:122 (+) Transcript_36494:119-484(+)